MKRTFIVIVLILIGVSIFVYRNNLNQVSDIESIIGACGLEIANLSPNDPVDFPFEVKGYINNSNKSNSCFWGMFEGTAGLATLYFTQDSKSWSQIGGGLPIFVTDWTSDQTTFSVKLDFNNGGVGLPAGIKMKVVFMEEDPRGSGNPDTFELPIYLGSASHNDGI